MPPSHWWPWGVARPPTTPGHSSFVHGAGSAAWTIIDLFLGLVLGPIMGAMSIAARVEFTTRVMLMKRFTYCAGVLGVMQIARATPRQRRTRRPSAESATPTTAPALWSRC